MIKEIEKMIKMENQYMKESMSESRTYKRPSYKYRCNCATALERLIQFMQFKDSIISDITGIKYFNDNDIANLIKLNTKQIRYTYLCVVKSLMENRLIGFVNPKYFPKVEFKKYLPIDATICPFCNVFFHSADYYGDPSCPNCPYAEEHMSCFDIQSDYAKICEHIDVVSIHDLLMSEYNYSNIIREIFGWS